LPDTIADADGVDRANTLNGAGCRRSQGLADENMKLSRRIALIAFIVALLVILALGFYRAVMHEEARPATAPAGSASAQ
jgi:hypothetical protein